MKAWKRVTGAEVAIITANIETMITVCNFHINKYNVVSKEISDIRKRVAAIIVSRHNESMSPAAKLYRNIEEDVALQENSMAMTITQRLSNMLSNGKTRRDLLAGIRLNSMTSSKVCLSGVVTLESYYAKLIEDIPELDGNYIIEAPSLELARSRLTKDSIMVKYVELTEGDDFDYLFKEVILGVTPKILIHGKAMDDALPGLISHMSYLRSSLESTRNVIMRRTGSGVDLERHEVVMDIPTDYERLIQDVNELVKEVTQPLRYLI